MSADKDEAARLADALLADYPTLDMQEAAALLRRWPDAGKPVAWLVEGWHDGKLIAHIVHLTLDEAKASAAVFSQHYTTTKMVPLYTAPPAEPDLQMYKDAIKQVRGLQERIAALESVIEQARVALEMLVGWKEGGRQKAHAALRKIEEVQR